MGIVDFSVFIYWGGIVVKSCFVNVYFFSVSVFLVRDVWCWGGNGFSFWWCGWFIV